MYPGQLLRQRRPVHARHYDIRQQEVDLFFVLARNGKRLDAIARFEHPITVLLKDSARQQSHRRFVLDQ
jgi:hypothetical protein